MAQKMQVLYVDDLDGSEAQATVRFGYAGAEYEIDLNKKHADQFAKAVAPYVQAARKVSSRARRRAGSPARHDQSDVRAWARSNGLKVSDRGRIPADVIAQYQAAH